MENPELHLAGQFALNTARHIFLTGKAGTGKTTLLKSIAGKTAKNFVIVAPTGVAAINAGGVTIHSMFHLPLTSFIPTSDYADMNLVTNRKLLLNHLKFRKEKLAVLREMELLIIDEASMVRSDILDAVDFALRTVRRSQKPFGGVQVLLIGDMHQLPPVVKEPEWNILRNYYSGPYFFDAHVWKQLDAVEIELKTIYRQSDERFLNLLNNIRHRQLEESDFEQLKKRYNPVFRPSPGEGYILLATHNYKADNVNTQELRRLTGRLHTFEAMIEGDFPENMYPCEHTLQLKEGAQVMFIRNDAEEKRYYNGMLAVVKKIDGGDITVTFNDSGEDFLLRRETWENIRYTVEQGSDKIRKDDLGTFSQFPLRLAWAVTIHKSQGLTFDKVIIDAGQSFAAGQVYVALSRCRTLEGIVLHSLIHQGALHNDERITEFSVAHHSVGELKNSLADAKAEYASHMLRRLYEFEKLRLAIADWKEIILEKDLPEKEKVVHLHDKMLAQAENIISTSEKFQNELDRLLAAYSADAGNIARLKQRCGKAIEYFTENIFTHLIAPLHTHIQEFAFKSRVKKYVRHAQALEETFWNKLEKLYQAHFSDEKLFMGETKHTRESLAQAITSVTSGKKEKGGTYKDTLVLYKEGMKLEDIASARSLAISTIKGHIARWIQSGEIDVHEVLPAETIQRIEKYLATNPVGYSDMKNTFGNEVDYGDIRMVVNHLARKKEQESLS